MEKLIKDESGQGLIEYALILALIAVVVIAILTTLGHSASDKFNLVNNYVSSAHPDT